MSILVLGLGNVLMRDDAFGVRVIEHLQRRYSFPAGVELVDGGTLGLDLLPRLEGVERLLLVDAMETGGAPGAVMRLSGEEVPRLLAGKLSVHQAGVADLLALAQLQGTLPEQLVAWGAQPVTVEMGLELSPAVARALEQVAEAVVRELQDWGAPPVALAQAARA